MNNPCRICGRPATHPYRVYEFATGRVIQGCIDDAHTGHLIPGSESEAWHNRPVAEQVRAKIRQYNDPAAGATALTHKRTRQAHIVVNAFANYRHPMETR